MRYSAFLILPLVFLISVTSVHVYAQTTDAGPLAASVAQITSPGLDTAAAQIIQAQMNTVWLTYPDSNSSHPKPSRVGYPDVNSWPIYVLSLGVIIGMEKHQQYQTFDTDNSIFSTTDGHPTASNGAFVFMSPPSVEAQMEYYESNGISPIYLSGNSSDQYWALSNGTVLENTVTPRGSLSGSSDAFVLEVFKDSNSNYILAGYGLTAKGSWAAAIYFKTLSANLSTYTDSWYVFRWQDTDGNGIPDAGDQYTQIASQSNHTTLPIPEFQSDAATLMLLSAAAATSIVCGRRSRNRTSLTPNR